MLSRFWGGATRCGNLELGCDLGSDLAEGNAGLVNAVILGAGRSFFEGKPKESGCVTDMDCRPTVGAVTDINGRSFLAGGFDEARNESAIAGTMYGRSKSNNRGPDPVWNET